MKKNPPYKELRSIMHTLAWIEIWEATDLDLNQFRRVLQRICIF